MANSLYSQPLTGKFLVGGSSGFDLSFFKEKEKIDGVTRDGSSFTSVEFSPMAGYFFTDQLVGGIELPLSLSSVKFDDDDKHTISSLAFAPFARYYFGSGALVPFVQAEIGIGASKDKWNPVGAASNTTRSNLLIWELGGGASMFLKDNVSIDFGLGYGSVSSKEEDEDRITNSGIGLSLGISVIL